MAPEPAPGPELAAVPQSVLDPRPGWIGATVPQLQPALVRKEEETAAEARQTSEPRVRARAEVIGSAPTTRELIATTSSPEIMRIPYRGLAPENRLPLARPTGLPSALH